MKIEGTDYANRVIPSQSTATEQQDNSMKSILSLPHTKIRLKMPSGRCAAIYASDKQMHKSKLAQAIYGCNHCHKQNIRLPTPYSLLPPLPFPENTDA